MTGCSRKELPASDGDPRPAKKGHAQYAGRGILITRMGREGGKQAACLFSCLWDGKVDELSRDTTGKGLPCPSPEYAIAMDKPHQLELARRELS